MWLLACLCFILTAVRLGFLLMMAAVIMNMAACQMAVVLPVVTSAGSGAEAEAGAAQSEGQPSQGEASSPSHCPQGAQHLCVAAGIPQT